MLRSALIINIFLRCLSSIKKLLVNLIRDITSLVLFMIAFPDQKRFGARFRN